MAVKIFAVICSLGWSRTRIIGLEQSLILVTALAPHIGYDKSADIAKAAHTGGLTLRQAAMESGFVSAEEFNRVMDPTKMLGPN